MASAIPILLMVRELGIGGSERQLATMARALNGEAFEVHVGCFIDEGVRRRELDEARVPILQLQVPNLKSPRVVPSAWRLVEYIRGHRIRLMHAFDYPTVLFATPAVRTASGCIALSSQRGHRDLMSARLRRAMRVTDRMAHGIVVNSEYLLRHMVEDERVPRSKIEVCPNGVDVNVFEGVRDLREMRAAECGDAGLVFGLVCALRPEKDVPTLLAAFARVNAGTRLVIVGDGPCGDEWIALADRLQLGERCRFVPATRDIGPWLRTMDVFVLPSTTEGLSNALMEAMASGCCVIASRAGGNPELVRDGENGFLFETGNVEGLAAQMRRAANDGALRQRLGARAKQMIAEQFSIAASASRMADIYARFLGEAASRRTA